MRLSFPSHALHKMAERRIQPEWVARTVEGAEYLRPEPRHLGAIRAFRRIPEFGNRWLRAVYVDRSGLRVVITDMGSRRGETPMRQEIFEDHAVVHFSGETVEEWDRSLPELTIGYGKDRKIVRLVIMNARKRAGTDQVQIIERYDPEVDGLDVELDDGAWHDTEETPEGFLVDFDSEHRIVALEFLGASELFPRAALERLNQAA